MPCWGYLQSSLKYRAANWPLQAYTHKSVSLGAKGPDQVYEFAIDRFPDFALLRVSLAVELIKAGQVEDAKRVLKAAIEQDPQLRMVILDHPGLEEIWC